ncbi:hypothetical protein ABK040_001702 [Willaertia magna]
MIYILEQIALAPITFSLTLLNIIIFLILTIKNFPVESVSFNYDKIASGLELWRCFTCTFSHFSIIHILFNIGSFWSYRYLEVLIYLSNNNGKHTFHSVMEFFKIIYLLMIGSTGLVFLTYFCFIKFLKWEQYRHVNVIGFSGVVFGIMTLAVIKNGITSTGSLFFGLNVPMLIIPFMSLFLTQLLVPQASFVGHLSGILIAFLIHFNRFGFVQRLLERIPFVGRRNSSSSSSSSSTVRDGVLQQV